MGKSKAKARRKRQDFQKVKLKVGRRLTKQNETKVDFKVKKIVLPCQIDDSNATSLRTSCNLSLEDCCRLLIHHNMSKRRTALKGLLELLSMDSSLGSNHLSKLLECVLPSLSAADTVVRKLSSQVVNLLVNLVSTRQLSSYFPLIAGHLCCTITHIDVPVRMVSAELLDCILQKHPSFLSSCSDRMIGLFIQLYIAGHNDPCSKEKSSLLSIDQLLSDSERFHALKSLLNFLKVLLSRSNECASFSGPFSYDICDSDKHDSEQFDVRTFLMESGPTVLNRLLAFWFEIAWYHTTEGELLLGETKRSFNDGQLKGMILILQILNVLIDYYVSSSMARQTQKRFAKVLNANVMDKLNALFPIRRSGRSEQAKERGLAKCPVTDTCIDVNIALCHLFAVWERLTGEGFASSYLDDCITYVFRRLEKRTCSPEQLKAVLRVLALHRTADKQLTNCLVKFFVSNRASITVKHQLLTFISDQYDASDLRCLVNIENIDFFACLLKLEGCSQASGSEEWPIHHSAIMLLEKIMCLCPPGQEAVRNMVEKIWCALLRAAPSLSIHLRRRCFSLAFRLSPFTSETFGYLKQFMREHRDLDDVGLLFEMILYGHSECLNDLESEHLVDLLSFVATVMCCCVPSEEGRCMENRTGSLEMPIVDIEPCSIPPLHYCLQLRQTFSSWSASLTFGSYSILERVLTVVLRDWRRQNSAGLNAENALGISLWSLQLTCSWKRKLPQPFLMIFWSTLCYLNDEVEKLRGAQMERWRDHLADHAAVPSLLLQLLENAFESGGKDLLFCSFGSGTGPPVPAVLGLLWRELFPSLNRVDCF